MIADPRDLRHDGSRLLANAEPYPYWFDDADEPDSNETLVRVESCDLCFVGGGYTGLWTAILAKERDPSKDVVLVEGATIGWGASGRNGGFMESSLTHGVANGQERFPSELAALERMGLEPPRHPELRSRRPAAIGSIGDRGSEQLTRRQVGSDEDGGGRRDASRPSKGPSRHVV